MKNRFLGIGALMLSIAAVASAHDGERHTVIVTASNTAANELLIYSPTGALENRISTQGQGGVSGNAGGIAQNYDRLAVVNFGSGNVSVFVKDFERATLRLESVIRSVASPVSVAFGDDHLYILTTTHVESHTIDRRGVSPNADGAAALLIADGSAAQVGAVDGELIVSEKSNAIESVPLNRFGAVAGKATLVGNIPTNVNAPFGLVTRGNDAFVTIAHANEISLVRNNEVLTVTGSGTQSAPCWLALDGPFLFSANSPSESVSRYAVYGRVIVQDAAVAATFTGNPTDIAYRAGLAAVVDANATVSHVSIFHVNEDGDLGLQGLATINNAATNGIAIVGFAERTAY
ncbi:MAG: hypothetical protein JWL65_3997 [Gammaproteobacteria bacterium]|jgi:hypothetical protein|nr:hypothetical protein [Gammaproteobacteria bacterium]